MPMSGSILQIHQRQMPLSSITGNGIQTEGTLPTWKLAINESFSPTWTGSHVFNRLGAPFFIGGLSAGSLVTNLNADMADGYNFDQSLLTSASPLFGGLTVSASGSTSLSRATIIIGPGGSNVPSSVGGSSTGDKILFYTSATEKYGLGQESSNLWIQGNGIKLYTNMSGSPFATMTLVSGSVGIGTISPSAYFHVTGITEQLRLGSSNLSRYVSFFVDTGGSLTITPVGNIGIGTSGSAKFHILNTTEQLRLGYDVSNYSKFSVSNVGDLTVQPTGNFLFDPVLNYVNPVTNYDINLGRLDKKYLTLHAAELWVETLVAQNTIATIGGRIIIAPTTQLTSDLPSASGSILVKHNQMNIGDIIVLQANGFIEFMSIDSSPSGSGSPFTYTVTRNLDGTGANDWYAGDAVVNLGIAGNGFIDLYSLSSINNIGFDYIFRDNSGTFTANVSSITYGALFPPTSDTNDALYIGMSNTKWSNVFFYLGTAGSFVGNVVAEYWNTSGSWTNLVTTGSPNFLSTGVQNLLFDKDSQTGWVQTTVNSTNAYWIRLRLVDITSWTTSPIQTNRRVGGNENQIGPTIVGNIRNSGSYNDWSESWAIGNLNGLYGYNADIYGIGLGKYSNQTSYLTITSGSGIKFFSSSSLVGEWQPGGNFTLGYVGTNKSNLFWDQAEGRLNFRGGTGGSQTQAYVDTDGAIVAASGSVSLNSTGIHIISGATYFDFRTGSYVLGGIYQDTSTTPSSQTTTLYLQSNGNYFNHTPFGEVILSATNKTAGSEPSAIFALRTTGSSPNPKIAYAEINTSGVMDFIGFKIGPSGYAGSPTNMLEVYGTISTGSGADIYTVPMTDYSSISTLSGWASTTTKQIFYKRVGKLIYCWFNISGSSSSGSATFTLPYVNSSSFAPIANIRVQNNSGTFSSGFLTVGTSSSTVLLFNGFETGATWTAGGTKHTSGEFFYETN